MPILFDKNISWIGIQFDIVSIFSGQMNADMKSLFLNDKNIVQTWLPSYATTISIMNLGNQIFPQMSGNWMEYVRENLRTTSYA